MQPYYFLRGQFAECLDCWCVTGVDKRLCHKHDVNNGDSCRILSLLSVLLPLAYANSRISNVS